jgi:hypothetical protein
LEAARRHAPPSRSNFVIERGAANRSLKSDWEPQDLSSIMRLRKSTWAAWLTQYIVPSLNYLVLPAFPKMASSISIFGLNKGVGVYTAANPICRPGQGSLGDDYG